MVSSETVAEEARKPGEVGHPPGGQAEKPKGLATRPTGSTTNASYNEYVFFAGRRIAQSNPSSGNVYYHFVDHLGSTRVVTTAIGTACYEVDYLPYGTENTPAGFTNTCSTRYRFTGYERDLETAYGTSSGNDYAFARYYNSRLGRFMSADPLDGDISDPQTLNRYSYVRNNPVNRIDPSGLKIADCFELHGTEETGFWYMGTYCFAWGPWLEQSDADAPPDEPIYTPARNLAMRVLSGNNDCANFFNSAVYFHGQDPGSYPPNAADMLASDTIQLSGGLADDTAGYTEDQNKGPGSKILLNGNPTGSFTPSVSAGSISGGVFSGSSLAGQTATILHELAHTLGLIPSDGADRNQSLSNAGTISKNCAGAIFAAIAGMF